MSESRFWSTAEAHGRNRVEYWQQAICEAIFELAFNAPADGLEATLTQYGIGAIKLSAVSISTGHEIIRSREAISRSSVARFNLNYLRKGRFLISHYGREIALEPGELILLDNREPYRVMSSDMTEHYSVHLPIDWLRTWLPCPEDAVAQPIRPDCAWRPVLVASLESVPLVTDDLPGTHELCADQIGGALAMALGPVRTRNTAHTRRLLLRFRQVLADMYRDHELTAAKVAGALGISPRYLHKILAHEGTTYGRELLRIRLDRAAAMLRNPRFRDLPVTEIGWRCGFSDPSHFSRRFRSEFGVPPGVFRTAEH